MRFLHTADWHLGKRLQDFSLHDQQQEALEQIIAIASEARPDAFVLAGDVFDTRIPQVVALELWEYAVEHIVGELGIPMVVIPGNHDHPERMAVNSKLTRRLGLHLLRSLADSAHPVVIEGVAFYGVPFHKPVHVNARLQDAENVIDDFDYAAAMRRMVQHVRTGFVPDGPAVLVGHAFVDGAGEEPEGEDAIQVGGAGAVPQGVFEGFAYTALGHIHSATQLDAAGQVHYSGSIYPYSFREAGHTKSVTLVEIDDAGVITAIERTPITVNRQVRVIEQKTHAEVLSEAEGLSRTEREHYTLVRITDRDAVPHALARLREWYPNSLLEQPRIEIRSRAPKLEGDHRTLDIDEVFRQFYRHVLGKEEMSDLESELLFQALQSPDDGTSSAVGPVLPQEVVPGHDGSSEEEAVESEAVESEAVAGDEVGT